MLCLPLPLPSSPGRAGSRSLTFPHLLTADSALPALNEPSHRCPASPRDQDLSLCCPLSHPIPQSKSFPGSQVTLSWAQSQITFLCKSGDFLWVFPGLNFPMSHQIRNMTQISPHFLPAAYYRSREQGRPPTSITKEILVCNIDPPQNQWNKRGTWPE